MNFTEGKEENYLLEGLIEILSFGVSALNGGGIRMGEAPSDDEQ